MGLQTRFCAVRYGLSWLLILLFIYVSNGNQTQTDVLCLKEIKATLEDPHGYLNKTWDFTNSTGGAICRFNGIDCWNSDENRVFNIKMTNMGLKGQFPLGLEHCTSLQELNLSGNRLSGSLPGNISKVISPFMVDLDLSNNDFSGEIPENLSNFVYLNRINLSHNRFSGQIPLQLGNLTRIQSFDVANNDLFGSVPQFRVNITAKSYANNAGLCGWPLKACRSRQFHLWYYIVEALGVGALSFVIIYSCIRFLSLKSRENG